jgi:Skp family chaperone for outer membrane proteins
MEKRNEYLEKLEAKLAQYDANLAEMKAKVAEIQSDMKSEYLSQIDNLENKRADFMKKYIQLRETSGHAWEDVKIGTERAWNELEYSIEKAISRFK